MMVCGARMSTSSPAHAASAPQAFGQMMPWPRPLAAIAAGRAPATLEIEPSGRAKPDGVECGTHPLAAFHHRLVARNVHDGGPRYPKRRDLWWLTLQPRTLIFTHCLTQWQPPETQSFGTFNLTAKWREQDGQTEDSGPPGSHESR